MNESDKNSFSNQNQDNNKSDIYLYTYLIIIESLEYLSRAWESSTTSLSITTDVNEYQYWINNFPIN